VASAPFRDLFICAKDLFVEAIQWLGLFPFCYRLPPMKSPHAAGFACVTIRPLLTAEEMDKAVEKWPPIRIPQEQ
jgi:hypothetical protein